jgi:hypothetical protein
MGWNSWDCFGAAVTEKQVRQNADYMAEKLTKHGWEYIVVASLTTRDGEKKTGGPRRRSRRDLVGLPLSRIDSFDDLLPGLGPPRSYQRRLRLAAWLTQTVDRDAACRGRASIDALGGFPTGRPWVSLANWLPPARSCISARQFTNSPAPIFLGSATHHAGLRLRFEPLGCDDRLDGALSARGAGCATCGDVNPDRRTARLSAAFASGGHIRSIAKPRTYAWGS